MKKYLHVLIAFCVITAVQITAAQERPFGLGIIIGEPTGISAKLWTSNTNAFDAGLGWSRGGDRFGFRDDYYYGRTRVHFHMDYLWHSWNVIHSSERFPLYYGIGGRINSGDGLESSLAVRGVVGIAWLPRDTPIDIFLELVPLFQLAPSSGFGIDAGIGVRYFF
jgi:hypothetical protein